MVGLPSYITPLIGGWIADRWINPRILVPVGELLMGAGYFVAWQATSKTRKLNTGQIALVATGTGFFKGVLSGVNRDDLKEDQLLIKVFSWRVFIC